jgi:hypothetical protein
LAIFYYINYHKIIGIRCIYLIVISFSFFFATCEKDYIAVQPNLHEINPNFGSLAVNVVYFDSKTQPQDGQCNTRCNNGISRAQVVLFLNREDWSEHARAVATKTTNNVGHARFDDLENTAYYLHVACEYGVYSKLVATEKGKLRIIQVTF